MNVKFRGPNPSRYLHHYRATCPVSVGSLNLHISPSHRTLFHGVIQNEIKEQPTLKYKEHKELSLGAAMLTA